MTVVSWITMETNSSIVYRPVPVSHRGPASPTAAVSAVASGTGTGSCCALAPIAGNRRTRTSAVVVIEGKRLIDGLLSGSSWCDDEEGSIPSLAPDTSFHQGNAPIYQITMRSSGGRYIGSPGWMSNAS